MERKHDLGFTLIELLVVISIGVFIVSLAAPRAAKIFDGFSSRLERVYLGNLGRRAAYESFVRQEQCSIKEEELETGAFMIRLVCGEIILFEKKQDVSVPQSLGFSLEGGLPLSFSTKGIRLLVDSDSGADKKLSGSIQHSAR